MKLYPNQMTPDTYGIDHVTTDGVRWTVCECGHPEVAMALACADETLERHGRNAFESYNDAVGGKTWDGKTIPEWDAVTDKVRDGWRTAAFAARNGARL